MEEKYPLLPISLFRTELSLAKRQHQSACIAQPRNGAAV